MRSATKSLTQLCVYIIVVSGAVLMITPFLWMVSTAIKSEPQIFAWPPQWIPIPAHFDNFVKMWGVASFANYFLNSWIVAGIGTIVVLFFCSLAGFAFAKYEFPARNIIFMILLTTLMIPGQVTLIPVFLIVKTLKWLNSYPGLIVPGLANVFALFLMRQFMQTIPNDLLDAARIDGCSEFRLYVRIILPLAKPIIATLGIFVFMGYWNELFWPLIITSQDKMKTLQLGLSLLKTGYGTTRWNILMAGTTLGSVPIIIVFLFLQRFFIQGIALTGLKE